MATDVEGSVHGERMKGNTFPMHQHSHTHQRFFSCCFHCLGWCQLYLPCASLRKQICALVVSWLLSFVTRCHNSRSVPPILLFLLENVVLLDNRWLSSLWGAPAKQKKPAVMLTVVFLNNRKRSSKLTPIYSGCASLITFSPQTCCHLKVCHNALERDGFFSSR